MPEFIIEDTVSSITMFKSLESTTKNITKTLVGPKDSNNTDWEAPIQPYNFALDWLKQLKEIIRNAPANVESEIENLAKSIREPINGDKIASKSKIMLTKKVITEKVIGEVSNEVYSNINKRSILLKACSFKDGMFEKLFHQLTKDLKKREIDYLEVSDTSNLTKEHAQVLGKFINSVYVRKLNIHGSNLKQYTSNVFINALMQLPKNKQTVIVFENDEVKCLVEPKGANINVGFSGCSIFIPANAIDKPTELSFQIDAQLVKLPGNVVQVTPIIQCLPSGQTFHKPITIRLPIWGGRKGVSTEFVVLTREDKLEDWRKECKIESEVDVGFVSFQTSHFSDDVVAALRRDVTLSYQLLVYTKKYTHLNDNQIIYVNCFPDNEDWFNKTHRESQTLGYCPCLPTIRIEAKCDQVISVMLTTDQPGCDITKNKKGFSCGSQFVDLDFISTIDPGNDVDIKNSGVKINMSVALDAKIIRSELIKVNWVPWEVNGLQMIHNLYQISNCDIASISEVGE